MSNKQEKSETSKMDFLNKNIETIGLFWVGILLVVAFSMLLNINPLHAGFIAAFYVGIFFLFKNVFKN